MRLDLRVLQVIAELCRGVRFARRIHSHLQGRTVSQNTVDFNQSFVGKKHLELLGSHQGRGISKIEDFDATASFGRFSLNPQKTLKSFRSQIVDFTPLVQRNLA